MNISGALLLISVAIALAACDTADNTTSSNQASTKHIPSTNTHGPDISNTAQTQAQTNPEAGSPLTALEKQGMRFVGEFESKSQLKGYVGIIDGNPVPVYLTANDDYAIVGALMDAQGNNPDQEIIDAILKAPEQAKLWNTLEQTAWIADGNREAKRVVYVFTDPNCGYCNRFWKESQPWLKKGHVQIRYIPVGLLHESSLPKAAAILQSPEPIKALRNNEENFEKGGIKPAAHISAEVRDDLFSNRRLMEHLNLRGTPAYIYRDATGQVIKKTGVPNNDQIKQLLDTHSFE